MTASCERKDSYSFSTKYTTLMASQSYKSYMLVDLEMTKVDLFTKKYVMFPFSALNHQSLFVLVNPGSNVGKLNDGDCLGTHLLHFDPLGNLTTHDKSSIHRKIMILMNKLWRNQSPSSSCESPFTAVTTEIYSARG